MAHFNHQSGESPQIATIMVTMTLKERIESRVEFRRVRMGRKTAFDASAFIDGVLYETTKATKELCVADLVRKAERKYGIHADSIPPCPDKPMNDYFPI